MNKIIKINNIKVKYKIRRSLRAKNIRLTLYPNTDLVLTVPRSYDLKKASQFIKIKSEWILKRYKKVNEIKGSYKQTKNDYHKSKELARELVIRVIGKYNKTYKFQFNKIYIKNQKTRWGSCSKNKNLSFNHRIIYLPKKLAEYVIVHELCHLKEMNHTKKFWMLVSKTFPEYLELNKDLKVNGFKYF